MDETGPKISLVEIILMLMIVVPVDILEAGVNLISAVPVIGQIALFIMMWADPICWAIIQFWLIMKGVKGHWYLAGSIIEFFPWVDFLPWRTATLIATIVIANRPEMAKVAKIAGAVTGKIGK